MLNKEKFLTTQEQIDVFKIHCKYHDCKLSCPLHGFYSGDRFKCFEEWRKAEYSIIPNPCPFCGGKVEAIQNLHNHKWNCYCRNECGYESARFDTKEEAFFAHNKISKGVK